MRRWRRAHPSETGSGHRYGKTCASSHRDPGSMVTCATAFLAVTRAIVRAASPTFAVRPVVPESDAASSASFHSRRTVSVSTVAARSTGGAISVCSAVTSISDDQAPSPAVRCRGVLRPRRGGEGSGGRSRTAPLWRDLGRASARPARTPAGILRSAALATVGDWTTQGKEVRGDRAGEVPSGGQECPACVSIAVSRTRVIGRGGGGEIECPLSARCGNLLATACGCGEFSACPVFSNAIAIPSPYLPRGPRQPRAGFRCLGTAAWNGSGALPYRAAAGSGRKNTNSPRSSRPPTEGGSRNYFQPRPRPPTRYRPGPKPSDGPIHPGMQRPCRRHRALQGDPGLRPPGAGLQRWGERRNRRQPDSRSAKLLFGTVE